ncbi:TPA: DNA alkylation repair protein [Candidatus Woesearchaeota archaeon]|nr:DNA alkylation repair protein [Candidatus Woesearchaeota archaeon]
MIGSLRKDIRSLANPEKAGVLQGFFRTGKGQYGEGDVFLGVTVPQSRAISKKYALLSFANIKALLKSKIHEERLVALLILVHRYQKGDEDEKKGIVDFYLGNTKCVDNWDLVDLSADKLLGHWLFGKDASLLCRLAESPHLWERRIAIVSTFHFIRNNRFSDTLKISGMLLGDKHDLIHKAVGWMLREVGKRDQPVLEGFLKRHHKKMPRTMLRYAIERLDEGRKKFYMGK